MKFEDLSQWDLNLIKSNGVALYVNTAASDRYQILAEVTLSCIRAKGYNLSSEPKNLVKKIAMAIAPSGFKSNSHSAEDLIRLVFEFLLDQKIDIIKDDTREATWSTPKASWHTPSDNYKKPWQW